MINYILQVIVFQILFLVVYDFFLSKETFFTKNIWYLLSTPVLSFLIPFIKIPTFQKAVPQEYIVYLPEFVLSPQKVIKNVINEPFFYNALTLSISGRNRRSSCFFPCLPCSSFRSSLSWRARVCGAARRGAV